MSYHMIKYTLSDELNRRCKNIDENLKQLSKDVNRHGLDLFELETDMLKLQKKVKLQFILIAIIAVIAILAAVLIILFIL